MSEGQKVPDKIVDDLLAEAMVSKLDKSKVKSIRNRFQLEIHYTFTRTFSSLFCYEGFRLPALLG